MTFDTPGLADIGRAVLGAVATLNTILSADCYSAESCDEVPLNVLQAVLRSDYNMIVGQGTVVAPNVFHWRRARKFCNFGIHRVVPGDDLVLTVQSTATSLLNGLASFGLPMQPDPGFGV